MGVGIAYSQVYTLEPNDSIDKVGTFDDLETLSIQQQNNSTKDTIHLKWRKVLNQVPQDWEASVCDNGNCYTSLLDSGTMNPVLPGEYGLLLLHITPKKTQGTAIVKYVVWETSNPVKQDTLTYILLVNSSLSVDQGKNDVAFTMAPCPVTEMFTISVNNSLGCSLMILTKRICVQ